jgi:hypothetical protein
MTPASRAACRRLCTISKCFQLELTTVSPRFIRSFHSSTPRLTDGVFRALTEARVRTPWIEAFRKKQAEGSGPTKASDKPQVPADRDLTPKRMSDSYHSVVSVFLEHLSPVKLTDPVIDLATCSRPMATGYLYQLVRAYKVHSVYSQGGLNISQQTDFEQAWYHFYGP